MKFFPRPTDLTDGSDTLRNWVWFWDLISLVIALFTTVYALLESRRQPAAILLIIGFALFYAVWYWFFIIHFARWGRSSWVLALSFAIMIVVLAGMTTLNGIYFMQLFSLYGLLFSLTVIRLAIPLTIFLSSVGAYRIITSEQIPLNQSYAVIGGFIVSTFFSILFGLFISAITRQSAERQKIIDELKAARDELSRAEREAGILEERQRLAREIHDTLAQGFTSIVMHLEAADQALAPDDPAQATVRLHLDRARTTARENLAEARRFVWALRSTPLERETLTQAIRQVAQRWAENTGMRAQVEISGDERPLPSPFEVTLLRSAQEALSNVYKHASAHQVTLTLTYMEDQVVLDVQDDGQGFDSDAIQSVVDGSGLGLVGMRERAEQLGGSLIVESSPGEGTTLVVNLPLTPASHFSSEASA